MFLSIWDRWYDPVREDITNNFMDIRIADEWDEQLHASKCDNFEEISYLNAMNS